MMWTLVRAEWLKTSRRPFDIGIVLVLLTTAAIAPVAIGAQALVDTSRLEGARHMIGPAERLFTVMLLAPLLALVLGPLLAASAVGSEYADGTWATLFSRTARRWPVLLAKFAVIAMTVTAVAAGAAMIWLIGCQVVGHFLPGTGPGDAPDGLAGRAWAAASVSLAEGLFNALIAALVAILTRSSLAGAAVGVLGPLVSGMLAPTAIGRMLPPVLFQHVRELAGSAGRLAPAATSELGTAVVVALLLLYATGMIAASAWAIKRQDVPC